MNPSAGGLSRRGFLAAGGALVVGFSLLPVAPIAAQTEGKLPGDLNTTPYLDSWIHIDADGKITVLTGKAELGQGIKTALLQVAAEELGVDPPAITLVTADTALTPNEGYTAGSHSLQDSGTAILNAAAQARAILTATAAARLSVPAEQLAVRGATIAAEDGRSITFGELVSGGLLHRRASAQSLLEPASAYQIIGKPLPRVDIPSKVTGSAAYVQDLRLPGMVHARVVRQPSYGAALRELRTFEVERLPGVLKLVRNGNYLAIIAEREYQAVTALRALTAAATWDEQANLPNQQDIFGVLQRLPSQAIVIRDDQPASDPGARVLEATYRRPYQMHGSIGPSCAVGLFENRALTVWTHSQGVYPLRKALAEMLSLAEDQVHCIHLEGSGCYGHNAADDVAADAALLAHALPGRPVRVQLMREQEHLWEPYGPAMVSKAKATLDDKGMIATWEYEVWSNTHSTRPGPAGNLLAARLLDPPFAPPPPRPIPMPEGGGDRNAIPLYAIPKARVANHFVPAMPIRVSALRSLGAYMNIFAIESFIDELAKQAGADPVEFRLRNLDDPRARDVVTAAAHHFGWLRYQPSRGRGRGFGFARHKNLAAFTAVAVEVEVEHETGRVRLVRAVAATDSGQPVNPDGIKNQIEGGIVQSSSWTLYEAVNFDQTRIVSADWSSYPIMRFSGLPESIEVHVIDRAGYPFLGTGEAAQGPTAAAIANAVADATGVRIRELPLTPERVKAAIGV
ncbi:MAG TPA: molybdopterin cofactor-binding domain-containing protein [Stellaceae bacterium]|nr:molybdopterin cofactor-binding domain-containing protein [Stellaceae bacterium]